MPLGGPIREIALAVVPPDDPAITPRLRKWMWGVFVVTMGLVVSVVLNVGLAFGLISIFGFDGFAKATDLRDLTISQQRLTQSVEAARKEDKQGRDQIAAAVIGKNIFDLRVAQCTAVKAHQVNLAQSYANQIADQKSQYYSLANRGYDEMSCAELGLQ
jgi:hypothetical protein